MSTLPCSAPPVIDATTNRERLGESSTFRATDGQAISYRLWRPEQASGKAVILLYDSSEEPVRWQSFVDQGGENDCWCFAVDARKRGDYGRVVADLEEFTQHVSRAYNIRLDEIAVVGRGVGALTVACWLHDYAPPARGIVMQNPDFSGTGTQWDDFNVTSARLCDDAAAIHTPVLVTIEKSSASRCGLVRKFADRLSSRSKAVASISTDEKASLRTQAFLTERFTSRDQPHHSATLASGSIGKYEALNRPPSLLTRIWFGIQWLFLNTVARLSRGVQIGWKSGFDSGQSLDHVYRNRAEGVTPLGRLIDRVYLDSIGWKGIRQRKVHLETMLDEAIEKAVEEFGEVTILDIAAGPGRYVLETIKRNEHLPVRAILCDRDPGGIEEGRALAKRLGLSDRVEFRQSDAFDPEAIQRAVGDEAIHIAIVSGLYELFPSNEMIERSLAGIGGVLTSGGWLLYTDQPWHPQQEMIARVLPNRDGEPWVMRCRSQAEMDALVREAGLDRRRLLLDRWGIFSVALARK